jgi:hypothetical protein
VFDSQSHRGWCPAQWSWMVEGLIHYYSTSNSLNLLIMNVSDMELYIGFSIGLLTLLWVRHYALSLRRRVGGVWWAVRSGGRPLSVPHEKSPFWCVFEVAHLAGWPARW